MSRRGRTTLAILLVMAVAVIAACAQEAAQKAAQKAAGKTAGAASPAARQASPPAGASATAPATATAGPRSTPSGSGSYRYTNARFGFSFDVPAGYAAQAPPADGDGLSFTNATRSATVTAYGTRNIFTYSPSRQLAGTVAAYQSAGDTVTYRFAKGDVIAVSGTTPHGTIFYDREVVYPAVIYALQWAYPALAAAQYDPLVTSTAGSFAPGPAHSG